MMALVFDPTMIWHKFQVRAAAAAAAALPLPCKRVFCLFPRRTACLGLGSVLDRRGIMAACSKYLCESTGIAVALDWADLLRIAIFSLLMRLFWVLTVLRRVWLDMAARELRILLRQARVPIPDVNVGV